MRPKKNLYGKKQVTPITGGMERACLVTDQEPLSENLRSQWKYGELEVRSRLVDLVKESNCNTYIVDTRVKDMGLWPAPLCAARDAASKTWLFLLSDISDASRLESLPRDARFFDREHFSVEEMASFVQRRSNPELRKKIAAVDYLEDIRAFLVRMESGKTYVLKVDDLPEADSSQIKGWSVARDHSHFIIKQASGNRIEVAWDDVLYHCEPEYEYYKRKQSPGPDSGLRVGERVRQLREAKGYSVQELADKAGMKRPNLSRLEHGKHQPSLETLEKIASALAVPVVDILAKRGNPEKS